MKTHAYVFAYERPEVLRECLKSLFERSVHVPDSVAIIDDGSPGSAVWHEISAAEVRYGSRATIATLIKEHNRGLSDSAVFALQNARNTHADFIYFIEGDYVFRPGGLDDVQAAFRTDVGKQCLGIVGYDHPNFRHPHFTANIFPNCMKAQVGEDNVNRAALHKPFLYFSERNLYVAELASNTCWTCYLNWRKIEEVAAEFPELWGLLDQACSPQENPNYPDSGKYKAQRSVDDGMLSHAISLVWNRWAIKHGIDRNKFGAWLNIKPSVAEHRFAGGMHA